jgi:hypothetical protein
MNGSEEKISSTPNNAKSEKEKENLKKIADMERNIKRAEDKLSKFELQLTEYDYNNPMFAQISKKIVAQKQEIEALMLEWENTLK